jgi:microcystin-dependent protein
MSDPFIAEIKIFAGNYAPRGWSFCNGQLLPVAQNTALFSLIGTTYGGDGETTTGLPNLKGRAPMHWGRGPGLTQRRIGEKVGSETVALADSHTPAHGHGLNAASNLTQADPSTSVSFGPVAMYATGGNSQDMAGEALGSAGGTGAPHNNMQPFLAMNFIIALVGVFPSRS